MTICEFSYDTLTVPVEGDESLTRYLSRCLLSWRRLTSLKASRPTLKSWRYGNSLLLLFIIWSASSTSFQTEKTALWASPTREEGGGGGGAPGRQMGKAWMARMWGPGKRPATLQLAAWRSSKTRRPLMFPVLPQADTRASLHANLGSGTHQSS